MSNVISRRIESVFTVDKSKLSRLLNVIDERLKALGENPVTTFEVETKRGKSFKTSNIDEILKHDNSVKNPITSFSIIMEAPEIWCHITYDKEDSVIRINIQADDSRKGNDLFAEIEEQIERSLIKNWVYKLKKYGKLEFLTFLLLLTSIVMIPLFIFTMISRTSFENIKNSDYLSSEDIAYLSKPIPISESELNKINYVYEYQSRKLKNIQASREKSNSNLFSMGKLPNIRVLLSILPFIIVLGGTYYTIWRTYIRSVFLWGDFEE